MSTRSNQRLQTAFTIALSLHALAALGVIGYSRTLSNSGTVASVMKMNWEVETQANAPAPISRPPVKAAHAQAVANQPAAAVSKSDPSPGDSQAPSPAIMENYLASIRDRLGNAIHLHEPRGSVSSQLVLKVAINSSGSVSGTEIEKTSSRPEVDRAVLAAFESLLPLAPFPNEWKKSAASPETITVRIPVVIRPKN
jgi:TonB family protein